MDKCISLIPVRCIICLDMKMGQYSFWTNINNPSNFSVCLFLYLDRLCSGNQDKNIMETTMCTHWRRKELGTGKPFQVITSQDFTLNQVHPLFLNPPPPSPTDTHLSKGCAIKRTYLHPSKTVSSYF